MVSHPHRANVNLNVYCIPFTFQYTRCGSHTWTRHFVLSLFRCLSHSLRFVLTAFLYECPVYGALVYVSTNFFHFPLEVRARAAQVKIHSTPSQCNRARNANQLSFELDCVLLDLLSSSIHLWIYWYIFWFKSNDFYLIYSNFNQNWVICWVLKKKLKWKGWSLFGFSNTCSDR